MKTFEINTLSDLITLAEMDTLTPEQFREVMAKCKPFLGFFLGEYQKTSEMAAIMKRYLQTPLEQLPIFWDIDTPKNNE